MRILREAPNDGDYSFLSACKIRRWYTPTQEYVSVSSENDMLMCTAEEHYIPRR
jgi:hypothetical protein